LATCDERHPIEIIERPVELRELRPAEVANGGFVVGAVREQKIACRDEGVVRSVH
jgi:hypothetical protein